jgi:signal peptidase II
MPCSRARQLLLLAALVLSTVGCDQATKHAARQALADGSSRPLLGGLVHFTLAQNSGGFLSLGDALSPGLRLFIFTVATSAFLVAALVALVRSRPSLKSRAGFGLALLAAGGLSNLIDRLCQHGLVTDFCILRLGPLHTGVFNVADVAILLGVAFIVIAAPSRTEASA